MKKTMGRILKSSDVTLEGTLLLDVQQAQPSVFKTNGAGSVTAANIVENHPEFAVIEIACSCGAKTRLRCNYGPPSNS
jgi:hypothetical protein